MPRYKHTFQFSNFQTLLTLSSFLPSSIPFIIEHTIASATITCNNPPNPNPTHEFSKRKISIHASPISKPFDSSNKFPFPKISHPIFSLPRNIKSRPSPPCFLILQIIVRVIAITNRGESRGGPRKLGITHATRGTID